MCFVYRTEVDSLIRAKCHLHTEQSPKGIYLFLIWARGGREEGSAKRKRKGKIMRKGRSRVGEYSWL